MIELVADHLANRLMALPYLDVVAGIARKQKIKVGDIAKTLPAFRSWNDPGKYSWLTPNSSRSGISYFETISNDLSGEVSGGKGGLYRAKLRLVVWLNMGRIAPASKGAIMRQVVTTIQGRYDNVNGVKGVSASPLGEVPQSPEIFRDYTYDEQELQFLMLPYDYFAFDFNVMYAITSDCLSVNFAKTSPEC